MPKSHYQPLRAPEPGTRPTGPKRSSSDGLPELHFELDQEALHQLARERFGKTILFTDQHDWSNEQILAAYRGQHQVEHAFRQMKAPQFVSWRPMFHWTDSKIRVHAFYCVLAPMLASLLLREVHRRAQERGLPVPAHSIPDLLQTLGAIREVAHLYPPEARTPAHITLSARTAARSWRWRCSLPPH